jgi:quercetin dioxygenase-like cupin family protein
MSTTLPLSPAAAAVLPLPGLVQFAEAGIVSKTLFAGQALRVVLFSLAKGQELTEHTSSRRAFVQILSGGCRFLFNGSWTDLRAGDLLHMPPGHLHAVKAVEGDCAFLLTLQAAEEPVAAATTEASSESNA